MCSGDAYARSEYSMSVSTLVYVQLLCKPACTKATQVYCSLSKAAPSWPSRAPGFLSFPLPHIAVRASVSLACAWGLPDCAIREQRVPFLTEHGTDLNRAPPALHLRSLRAYVHYVHIQEQA